MTCVECNNFAGHTYEYSVKERDLLIKQANSLVSDVSGSFGCMKMKVGDVEVNVEYSVENGTKRRPMGRVGAGAAALFRAQSNP